MPYQTPHIVCGECQNLGGVVIRGTQASCPDCSKERTGFVNKIVASGGVDNGSTVNGDSSIIQTVTIGGQTIIYRRIPRNA